MRKHIIIAILALIPFAMCAQVTNESRNQVTVAYRPIFNLKSGFSNTATTPASKGTAWHGGGQSTTQSGSVSDDSAWSNGFEVTYQRRLGGYKQLTYGGLIGVGYNQASFGQTFMSGGASVANSLDLDIITGRVGPYIGLPITPRLTLSGSAGLAVANVNEKYTAAGSSIDHSDFLYGPYVGGGAAYRVYKNWSVASTAYYAPLGSSKSSSGGQGSSADFGNAILLSIGLGVSF